MEAKALPMQEVVHRLGIDRLVRTGAELVGPCPICGGRDRFGVNLRSNAFLCRKCGMKGGDQIGLVMQVQGLDFRAALAWLVGDAPAQVDPAERARRAAKAKAAVEAQERESERRRQASIKAAAKIWSEGRDPAGTDVDRYLEIRGLPGILPRLTRCLRLHPALPYMVHEDRRWVEIDRRPAMLAAIQAPGGRLCCVNRTWIDVCQPKGKAVIQRDGQAARDANGRPFKAKKTLGSTKGGAIRLITPERYDVLVMGEGIETTLTAAAADAVPGAAYWAGVDLGNMAGRMIRADGKRHSGVPDMSDGRAFVPPPWVRRLIFIMDGDSEPKMTRAKLECGLRRAMAVVPGLKGQIVKAGDGVDLNDVLLGKGGS
jgi:hypothetical protein